MGMCLAGFNSQSGIVSPVSDVRFVHSSVNYLWHSVALMFSCACMCLYRDVADYVCR